MTLTAMFATQDWALGVSDMRRTNLKTGQQIDDTPKVLKVNDLLAGWSGHWVYGKLAMDLLQKHLRPGDTVERAAALGQGFIQELLKEQTPEEVDLTLHFCGRDNSGKMVLLDTSVHEGYKIMRTDIPPEAIRWRCSFAEYDPAHWLGKQFRGVKSFELPWVKRIAIKLVKHVADNDIYVSRERKIETLEGVIKQ